MTEPIPVDTAVVAAALGRDPAYVRRKAREGVITPIGKAPRKGKGGRPSDLFDLRQVLATLTPDTPERGTT